MISASVHDGLVDELSLFILPIANGVPNTPTTFKVSKYLQKRSTSLLLVLLFVCLFVLCLNTFYINIKLQ